MRPPSPKFDLARAVYASYVGTSPVREASCFVAEGMGVVAMSTQGNGAHVDFDFFRIWEAMKAWRDTHAERRLPRFAWMYHTHPSGMISASDVDKNAVKGWVKALGMPIQMAIVSNLGVMRYACLPENVVKQQGIAFGDAWECFLINAICGISCVEQSPTQDELDAITEEIGHIIPVDLWGNQDLSWVQDMSN